MSPRQQQQATTFEGKAAGGLGGRYHMHATLALGAVTRELSVMQESPGGSLHLLMMICCSSNLLLLSSYRGEHVRGSFVNERAHRLVSALPPGPFGETSDTVRGR